MEYLLAAFFVTALWDVLLRAISTGILPVPVVRRWKWVRVLCPYFEQHTLLSAALIAGFVGSVTYAVIAYTWPHISLSLHSNIMLYTLYVIGVSGIIGIPMRLSGLFPKLEEHYYETLGFAYSFATDAFSGFVVMASMLLAQQIIQV